jgi:predicted nucleotidyltransferase
MREDMKKLIEKAAAILISSGATEVYVFGSATSEEPALPRDLDLAVSGLPPERYFKALGDAIDALGISIDLVDLDEDNPFTRYLKRDGVLARVA